MAPDHNHRAPARALYDDHQDLNSLLRRIKERLSGTPWHDPIVPSLMESLSLHLETHFQNEESEDGFDEWVALAPRVADRTEALLADHRRFRAVAFDLATRSRTADRTPEKWEALRNDYNEFYEELARHEAEEHDILNEVYQHDVGSKD